MHLLFVCRLFSGFRPSVEAGAWQPTGAPTIYKLLDALTAGPHRLDVVFTDKDFGSDGGDRVVALRDLDVPVTVLAAWPGWRWLPRRIAGYLGESRHVLRMVLRARRERPDLVYLDRTNVLAAAMIARLRLAPVVLRVMGVTPDMHAALTGNAPYERLLRWAWRSPFAHVVCTQDGSGGERWMERALAPAVPRTLLLNGVDPEPGAALPENLLDAGDSRMTVLFVGRLEEIKGCDTFIDAVLGLPPDVLREVHAIVLGTGSRGDALRRRVRDAGAEANVTFIDRLPHRQVAALLARIDVYVSLNRQGNLSNANLEALRTGVCTVMLAAPGDHGIDEATEDLFGSDVVARIPRIGEVEALRTVIAHYLTHPEERRAHAAAAARIAAEVIPDWRHRIAQEVALLDEVAGIPA